MNTPKPVDDRALLALAARNQETAWSLIDRLGIRDLWRSIGAESYLVGSLRTGLLMTHLDIDVHVYSGNVDVEQDFLIMGRLAANRDVLGVQFVNGLQTEEQCLEWHCRIFFEGAEWTLDMIHMVRGSRYDGYFERVADRLLAALTPETRNVILRLKYEMGSSVPGIVFCQAVIRDGVRTRSGFESWLKENPLHGIVDWMP